MPAPVSLVDLDPDFFCSPSRSQWLREYRLALPWTQAQLADACGVSRSTVVRWENDQVPVPKSAVMVVFLANVIMTAGGMKGKKKGVTWLLQMGYEADCLRLHPLALYSSAHSRRDARPSLPDLCGRQVLYYDSCDYVFEGSRAKKMFRQNILMFCKSN